MTAARRFNRHELFFGKAEPAEIEITHEGRAPLAVTGIVVVPDPPSVVKNSEERHDRRVASRSQVREVKADRGDVAPVILAVERRVARSRDRSDELEDRLQVERVRRTYARTATFRVLLGTFASRAGLLPFRPRFDDSDSHTVSMMSRVVTYGSAFAFGRRSSIYPLRSLATCQGMRTDAPRSLTP